MSAPSCEAAALLDLPSDHLYRLAYQTRPGETGNALEFNAHNLIHAVEFILDDPAMNSVDVWEDGEFVFSLRR